MTQAGVLIDTNWFLTTKARLRSVGSLDDPWDPTSGTVNIADHDYDFDKIYSVRNKEWRLLHLENPVVNETPIGRARLTELMISEVPKKFAYVLQYND